MSGRGWREGYIRDAFETIGYSESRVTVGCATQILHRSEKGEFVGRGAPGRADCEARARTRRDDDAKLPLYGVWTDAVTDARRDRSPRCGLIGALLLEQDEEWSIAERRSFGVESMKQLSAPALPPTAQEIQASIG
jgi:hypothetical protein